MVYGDDFTRRDGDSRSDRRAGTGRKRDQKAKHHHYKLIDMGTLGGPTSFPPTPYALAVNSHGLAIAEAATPTPDPNSPNCFQPDCLVNHAITWQNGLQTDLGTFPGGYGSYPSWSNDQGTVVGWSENGVIDPLTGNPEVVAVLWKDGRVFDLGTFGGNAGYAQAINNWGHVVGEALNSIPDDFATALAGPNFPVATQFRAFLWQDGVMQDLGTLGGNDAVAVFVNNLGQVAGVSYKNTTPNVTTGIPTIDPFFWQNGKMVDIGTLGGTIGYPIWMNSVGQVTGYSDLAGDGTEHPFLWSKAEGIKDLGTLGGTFGHSDSLNDAGQVVGTATTSGDQTARAFLWRLGVMTDLGTIDADPDSEAFSINSEGQIVGTTGIFGVVDNHGFLWENGGPLVDLAALVLPGSGVTVFSAVFINDRGEIAGSGMLPNGDVHSVLLIPCDEHHADIEACEFDEAEAVTVAPVRPAEVTQVPAASLAKLSSAQMMTRFQSLRAGRHRGFETPRTLPQ